MNQKYIPVVLGLIFLLVAATILIKPLPVKAITAIVTVICSGYFYQFCTSLDHSKNN
ncbi:hypothetical protein [Enterococcus plantarum]|uniref:hypothetical protein n=1 Tax=Enterococcus plantarum TaxID=1077675 RepID=UPI0015E8AABC|nr:hypothetical protein [Enterococcus plantarum]